MSQTIPSDAFDFYVALGDGRSYQRVADHFGVAKRSVTRHARVNDWPGRLAKIEEASRVKTDAKLAEGLAEMRERHLKTLKAMNARVLTAIREFPLTSGMEAIRAAEIVIKLERLIAGEPTERHASIEETMRREMDALLVYDEDDDEGEDEQPLVHADAAAVTTEDADIDGDDAP